MQIACALPWPPSINHAWKPTLRSGKLILSPEYKAFKKAVGDTVLERRIPRFKLQGRLAVLLQLRPPNARDFDIDNRVKCCLDALAGAGVIDNDRNVDLVFISRGPLLPPRGAVWIQIEEISAGNFSILRHFANQVFSSNLTHLENPAILADHDTAETDRTERHQLR